MPAWLIQGGRADGYGAQGSNNTRYYIPFGYMEAGASIEAHTQVMVRDSYTLSNLWVRVPVNYKGSATTVRSRVGGANGNQAVTVPASTSGTFEDTSNSDSLSNGNLFNVSITTDWDGMPEFSIIAFKLATASNTTPIECAANPRGETTTQATAYIGIEGCPVAHTAEVRSQYKFRVAATLSNLRAYVITNTLSAASTLRTRKNGANGNQSLSIGSAATGSFEDTSNSDSIAVTDLVNYQRTGGTSGSIEFSVIQMKSDSDGRVIFYCDVTGSPYGSDVVNYTQPEIGRDSTTTTESDNQVKALAAFTAKNLFVYVIANNINGASSIKVRKNGADSNLGVSIPSSSSGVFEDTSNEDSFGSTDLINYKLDWSGTSGNATVSIIGFQLDQAAAAKTSSDTGSGVDAKKTGNPMATYARSETGGGAEGLPARGLFTVQTGSGSEHILDRALVLISESGSGLDTVLSLLGKIVSESGTGVENSYLHILEAVKSSADSGAGAEASSLAALFQRDETGEGIEQVIARALFSREPQMGAIDLARVITAAITGTGETGSGAEASLVAFYHKVTESGEGVDSSSLEALFTSDDSGVGAEAITLLAAMIAHDTGQGVEAVLSYLRKLVDSGEGAEVVQLIGAVGRRMRMKVYQLEAFNLKVYTSEVGQ